MIYIYIHHIHDINADMRYNKNYMIRISRVHVS